MMSQTPQAPHLIFAAIAIMTLGLTGCGDIRGPSLHGNPRSMSSDTLCFRNAVKPIPEFRAEIMQRNLDCNSILEDDPLIEDRRF